MDRRRPDLNTDDVHLPPLLQHANGSSEEPPTLQGQLVCGSSNDAQLHLHYLITPQPNPCQLRLKGMSTGGDSFPTDQLINSSLIDRIVSMTVANVNEVGWDQQDLVRLASEFRRPVDVSLYSSHFLPLLPLAEMPMMRVVKVEKKRSGRDLTPGELNFMADLPHLTKLSMSRPNVKQLSQHVGPLSISKLEIDWESSNVQNLDVDFSENFSHLHTLSIDGFICKTDMFSFTGVSLPHLFKCDLFLAILPSFKLAPELHSTKELLTSMRSAMPKLKDLKFSTWRWRFPFAEVADLISLIFQFCPTTVEDLSLTINVAQRGGSSTLWEWNWAFGTLFTSVLESHVKRVTFDSLLNPEVFGLALPFQFEENPSGEQVGQPVKTIRFNAPVHKYQLKRPNGQLCTVDVISWGYSPLSYLTTVKDDC